MPWYIQKKLLGHRNIQSNQCQEASNSTSTFKSILLPKSRFSPIYFCPHIPYILSIIYLISRFCYTLAFPTIHPHLHFMAALTLRLIGWEETWHLDSAKRIYYTSKSDPETPIVTAALALAMTKSARAQVQVDRSSGSAATNTVDILGQAATPTLLYGMYALSWVCTQHPTASAAAIQCASNKLWAQAERARLSHTKPTAAVPRPAAHHTLQGLSGAEVGVCKLAAQYRQAWGYSPAKPGSVTSAVLAARTSASAHQWRRSADRVNARVLRASVSAAVAASGIAGHRSTLPALSSQELSYARAHQLGHNAWAMGPWYASEAAQLSPTLALDASS